MQAAASRKSKSKPLVSVDSQTRFAPSLTTGLVQKENAAAEENATTNSKKIQATSAAKGKQKSKPRDDEDEDEDNEEDDDGFEVVGARPKASRSARFAGKPRRQSISLQC